MTLSVNNNSLSEGTGEELTIIENNVIFPGLKSEGRMSSISCMISFPS